MDKLDEEFGDVEGHIKTAMADILTGKAVGHQICHVWYDSDTQQRTVYQGKLEKLLKKAGGTYRVGYWEDQDGQNYEADAVNYDVSKYALAADLMCGELTLS